MLNAQRVSGSYDQGSGGEYGPRARVGLSPGSAKYDFEQVSNLSVPQFPPSYNGDNNLVPWVIVRIKWFSL